MSKTPSIPDQIRFFLGGAWFKTYTAQEIRKHLGLEGRKDAGVHVSSILYKMTMRGELRRYPGKGPKGGYGYTMAGNPPEEPKT